MADPVEPPEATDPNEARRLAALLQEGVGSLRRIKAIRTLARETLRVDRRLGAPDLVQRIATYRAAGGRIRIETYPAEDSDAAGPPLRALVLPGFDPAAHAATDAASRALREARLEPRNVLAHLGEKSHVIRHVHPAADGSGSHGAGPAPLNSREEAVELDLPEESARYLFDPVTHLCAERIDSAFRTRTHYLEWHPVDGIATPFLEIVETEGSAAEIRMLAIAYDLDLPDTLFAH